MSIAQRLACLAIATLVSVSLIAPKASATDYVIGSDAESITVDRAIHPGKTVKIPAFGIYNKGTKRADYEMAVVAAGKADGLDPSWVELDPRTFSLDPGGVTKIRGAVLVPANARPGTYRALLAGRIVNPGGSDVRMSVGIGPMLTIRVTKGWWLSAGWFEVTGFFQRSAPWSYFGIIVGLLVLLAVILSLLSRKSVRLGRDRPSGGGESGRSAPGSGSHDESAQGQA